MPKLFERFNSKKTKDARILVDFVGVFCRENHQYESKSLFPGEDEAMRQVAGDRPLLLCPDCRKLLYHGVVKLLQCPYDPKPMCKKCETHCYASGYREKMREVMRFSGLYMVKHGRLDMLFHYFF
ncbi:MAG TPA: nitrous oxide-stimulated promoter family protein [Dehalococcoidia bacterium]|nr:nitrous oxide-stimulated promoter family protein [Dehalococcoidia bacterium]